MGNPNDDRIDTLEEIKKPGDVFTYLGNKITDLKNDVVEGASHAADTVAIFIDKHPNVVKVAFGVAAAAVGVGTAGVGGIVAGAGLAVVEQLVQKAAHARVETINNRKLAHKGENSHGNDGIDLEHAHGIDLAQHVNENDLKAMMNIMNNFQNHHEENISQRDLEALARVLLSLEKAMPKKENTTELSQNNSVATVSLNNSSTKFRDLVDGQKSQGNSEGMVR